MSADRLPDALQRLIGQHPAALRTVRWQNAALRPDELGHLEIETKHGQVVLIDHSSGAVYANPPIPPGSATAAQRQQRDLSAELPLAFDGRPVFREIAPVIERGRLRGWCFSLSTGVTIKLTLSEHSPLLLAVSN